jgi:glycosyltransferase involved in cell wall biosynthesis
MSASDFPLVSIITPVYNGAEYLEELITSVQNQDYPNIEHIVINDGSDDEGATFAILKRYPQLRCWSRENRGQYATMNEGLREAKGEVVCFISADDQVTPGAISAVMTFWGQYSNEEAIRGFSLNITENGTLYAVQNPLKNVPPNLYAYIPHILHCVLYVKTASLRKHELWFDETLKYTGDYDWTFRLIRSGLRMRYIPQELAKIRVHPQQASVKYEIAMLAEKRIIMARYKVNPLLNTLFHWLLTFHSAGSKIMKALRSEGFPGVYKGVGRWYRRKLDRR